MSMTTVAQVIEAVQTVVTGVTGVRFAAFTPPDQVAISGVSAICYPAAGRWTEVTAGRMTGEHTLHLLIGTPLRNLRSDWLRVIGMGDGVAHALLTAGTLAGVIVQTNDIPYTFGPVDWAGEQLFGWLFELSILTIGEV